MLANVEDKYISIKFEIKCNRKAGKIEIEVAQDLG